MEAVFVLSSLIVIAFGLFAFAHTPKGKKFFDIKN